MLLHLHPDHRRRKVQLKQNTLRDKSDLKSAADFFANLSEVIGQCSFLRFLLKRRLETGYRIVLMVQCRQSLIQIKSITENKSVRSLNLCRNKWCSKDQRCSNGILNRVGPWTTSGTPLKFLQKLRVRLCVAIRAHERQLELSQLSYTLLIFKRKRLAR